MKTTQVWINDLAKDRSFVDVGGLWGTKNERITDAAMAGANLLTMVDIAPLGHDLWKAFDQRCRDKRVKGYRRVSANIMDPASRNKIGLHDIVHCSGVIYHMPDPFSCLMNLKAITASHLLLVSMVVPEEIENSAGRIALSGGDVLYVPALSNEQKAILSMHFENVGVKVHTLNGPSINGWTKPNGNPNFGPWWWMFTPSLLREMLRSAGFDVVDDGPVVANRSYGYLCKIK